MGLRFKLNLLPKLLAGEKVLYFKDLVWLASCRSAPNYRIFFPAPPFWETGLYITNKRILFVSTLARIVNEEFDQWFDLSNRPPDTEIIKEVDFCKHKILGTYLEIVSINNRKMWYRSKKARVKIYFKDAEYVHKIILNSLMDSILSDD